MPHTPKEGLTLCYTINAEFDWNTKHVSRVEQRRNYSFATFNLRTSRQSTGDTLGLPSLKLTIWSKVEIDACIGEGEQRTGSEWDWTVLVVWVEG